jgi:hypothetical protein
MSDSTLKYRRYRRLAQLTDAIGWLLILAGLVAPSVANGWGVGLLLMAAGTGVFCLSWQLHRAAGLAQVDGLEDHRD